MSQKPGGPSYASRLRGEPASHKPSRVGRSGGNPPPMLPSAFQNKKNNTASMPSNAGTYLPSTASNLAPYSQAHTRTQKPMAADSRVPTMSFYGSKGSATASQSSRQAMQTVTEGETMHSQPSIADSMNKLSINSTQKSDPVLLGRCLNWERPTPSASSKVSKYSQKPSRGYLKPAASAYSIDYKRSHDQTPMEQAGYREYLPFEKCEFKVGMIIRMNIHESDFNGPSKAANAQASQASTLVDGGRGGGRGREHRHDGDFGPIYSENRIAIVVNVAEDVYTAIPLFTHGGKGLNNILDKRSWVSVEDHRYLGNCVQQSAHEPLQTLVMSPDCEALDPVSAAWIPYAFPCRYDVPVAYQGKLNKISAKRLVRLHRETWVDSGSDGE